MLNLKIIIASTRPGRKGPSIADWFFEIAKKHPGFDTELIDLAKVNLPFLDEPEHPRFKKYQHQHTKDWSAKIDAADAIVLVTAEYNYGILAPLKNALDFLYLEWNYKPVGFVSYGGVAGGTRAVQMTKQVTSALKMVAMTESVHIPFFAKMIDAQGKFTPDQSFEKSAAILLDELRRWAETLKPMRGIQAK